MSTTRIFVDCHVFDYGFQGTRTYIQGLYLELIKDKKNKVFLAASNIENLQKIFGTAENVTYLKYKSENKFYRLLFDIPKMIKNNAIDYAHFQYIVPPIKNCKYIVSTHDVLFLSFPEYFPKLNGLKNKILYKYSARKSDIILTGSEFSKQEIQKHFNSENVYVTVYGVESVFFEAFDKVKVAEEVSKKFGVDNYLIYTSRHEPRKNHFRLLKAFIDLKLYENYKLVLIGDVTFHDPNFDALLDNADESIRSKVLLLNHVKFDDMISLLRGASLSVYPSIAEGFGLPPLESVAAGIPTLCSNTTSMGEFTFFGEDFIDPLDTEDIKNKIQHKLNHYNAERQKELSKFVASKYNWKEAARLFEEILDKQK